MVDIPVTPPQGTPIPDVASLLLLSANDLNDQIKMGFAASQRRKTILDRYQEIKLRVLSFPGKSLARHLKKNGKNSEEFCRRIKYCERKDWFKERLEIVENLAEERAVATASAAQLIIDKVPDGKEYLDTLREFVSLTTDEIIDNAIPIALVVKVFKYGLDEYCNF